MDINWDRVRLHLNVALDSISGFGYWEDLWALVMWALRTRLFSRGRNTQTNSQRSQLAYRRSATCLGSARLALAAFLSAFTFVSLRAGLLSSSETQRCRSFLFLPQTQISCSRPCVFFHGVRGQFLHQQLFRPQTQRRRSDPLAGSHRRLKNLGSFLRSFETPAFSLRVRLRGTSNSSQATKRSRR